MRRAVFAACLTVMAASGADAQQTVPPAPAKPVPSACSAAYYKALETVRTGRGAALGGLHRALRTPDAELPGKWLIAAPAAGKPKAAPKPERVCVEMKEQPGRQKACVRYETKQPIVSPELLARSTPSAEEARVLKAIGDVVDAKGALPDVGNNGRHNFLVQRVAQDIRLYASQPEHPSLCAGAPDLIEFYANQVAPLKRRGEEVTTLARQAKELAAARVRNISVTETRLYDKAAADVAKVQEQRTKLLDAHKAAVAKAAEQAAGATTSTPPPAEPTLPPLPVLPAKPNAPAQPQDYLTVGFVSLAIEALRPLLPPERVLEIADEKQPLKLLSKARTALLDLDMPRPTSQPEVQDASLMALRLLEAQVYADLYVTRYRDLDTTLFGALTDLKAAQTSSCVCRD